MADTNREGSTVITRTVKHREQKFSVEFDDGQQLPTRSDQHRTVSHTETGPSTRSSRVPVGREDNQNPSVDRKSNRNVSTTETNLDVQRVAERKSERQQVSSTEQYSEAQGQSERRRRGERQHVSSTEQYSEVQGQYDRTDGQHVPVTQTHAPKTTSKGSMPHHGAKVQVVDKDLTRFGPGPANYALPTTIGRHSVDHTKRQSPAFTFGSRSWSYKTDSPGPAYGIDSQLGHRGRESRPSFSFGSRVRTPVRKDLSPGPGAYNTDSPPLWEKKAPQYSMSPRTSPRRRDNVPPPNSYKLPSTIGSNVPNMQSGPAPSIRGRREKHGFAEDLAKTPGPANYAINSPTLNKRRSPEYSIKGRNWFSGARTIVPGPGAYSPQNVYSHLEQSPRHVIGVKHSDFKLPTITQADVSD